MPAFTGRRIVPFPHDGQPGAPGRQGRSVAGPGYAATSDTSLLIGTGSKTFTTRSGLAYNTASRVRAASRADPTNYMEGMVTAYVGNGLTLDVDTVGGSGTFADWDISIAGTGGAGGATLEIGEVPSGTINGSNAVFTLAFTPTGNIMLWRSYELMYPGVHYNLSGATITYTAGNEPSAGPPADTHVAIYKHA